MGAAGLGWRCLTPFTLWLNKQELLKAVKKPIGLVAVAVQAAAKRAVGITVNRFSGVLSAFSPSSGYPIFIKLAALAWAYSAGKT
jgi:hypothetical protein